MNDFSNLNHLPTEVKIMATMHRMIIDSTIQSSLKTCDRTLQQTDIVNGVVIFKLDGISSE